MPPKIPQLNGLVEWINRTLVEKIQHLLSHADLPKSFWGEALSIIIHVLNLSPSAPLQSDLSYRVWIGKDVSFGHLKVLGVRHLFIFLQMRGPSLR